MGSKGPSARRAKARAGLGGGPGGGAPWPCLLLMTERFSADWLALREPFDVAARSVVLAERLVGLLPARPRLLDLGAGTGGLFRWLAPLIGRAQVWTLADADPELLADAFFSIADWAEGHGWTVTWPGHAARRALLVHAPSGAWRVEALQVDLADAPAGLPLAAVDAVLSSALLDLVSAAWLERLVAALRTPFLATLDVDGREAFLPAHPDDARVRSSFRRDQGRDKGFGRALGVHAPRALHAALAGRGFAVASAPSDWRIAAPGLAMSRALVEGHAEAAVRASPGAGHAIDAWRRARMRHGLQGRLAIRIGHRDSLGLPPR